MVIKPLLEPHPGAACSTPPPRVAQPAASHQRYILHTGRYNMIALDGNSSLMNEAGMSLDHFISLLDGRARELFFSLDTPIAIQSYLDSIPYSTEEVNRCPVRVLQDGLAHCLDGALLAAAALRRLGNPTILIDLFPEPGTDDDHILAIFQQERHYGAIAKSNYVGLRFREAVYRSYRELVMSYFNDFFNIQGEKTLRFYSGPYDLSRIDRIGWMWDNAGASAVEKHLHSLRLKPVITEGMIHRLSPLDKRSYEAGMMGVNMAGLFKPVKR